LLTPVRTKGEKFVRVVFVPKPFHLLAAVVAIEDASKDHFAVDDIALRFPPGRRCRSGVPIKRSRRVSAIWTRIPYYIAAAVRVWTNGLELAWSTMTPFRGVAKGGHGIVAHFCRFVLRAAFI
jgi:hypothetical protein